MKMKKMLSAVLASICFITCTAVIPPYSVYARDSYSQRDENDKELAKFYYTITDGAIEIKSISVRTDELVIPSEIDGYPVKTIKGVLFTDVTKKKLKSLIFEDGIEVIQDCSFGQCPNVTQLHLPNTLKSMNCDFWAESIEEVTIPGTLESIPRTAFYLCKKLKNVTIEDGVQNIGEMAFASCPSLKRIVLPNSVKYIGENAFSNALEEITLSDNLEYIGNYAFAFTQIEKIKFPETLKGIGERAFYKTKLKEIKLPSSIESIGYCAFLSCEQLKKVYVPRSIMNNPNSAWRNCTALEEVNFEGEITKELYDHLVLENNRSPYAEKYNSSVEGDFVIFNGNYLSKYVGKNRNPIIPDNITTLGEFAFRSADIDTVTFSPNIKIIPEKCFLGSKLKELTIPSTIKEVKSNAFFRCEELEKLTIEDGVEKIGESAFQNCRKLFDVTKGKSVRISSSAFNQTPQDKEFVANGNYETPKPTATPDPTTTPTETASPTTTPAPEVLTVEGGEEITVKVNDKTVEFPDAKPFVDENDRTQVPIRAVSEMLNCKVDWQQETATAVITKSNGDTVKITLNSDVMTLNDTPVQMDTAAMLKDDRTFIPVRFVAEALGLKVNWIE